MTTKTCSSVSLFSDNNFNCTSAEATLVVDYLSLENGLVCGTLVFQVFSVLRHLSWEEARGYAQHTLEPHNMVLSGFRPNFHASLALPMLAPDWGNLIFRPVSPYDDGRPPLYKNGLGEEAGVPVTLPTLDSTYSTTTASTFAAGGYSESLKDWKVMVSLPVKIADSPELQAILRYTWAYSPNMARERSVLRGSFSVEMLV